MIQTRFRNTLDRQGVAPVGIEKYFLIDAKKEIKEQPLKYFLFWGLEGFKMFFWESTQIGFVSYPDWLKRIYDNLVVKNLWRVTISLVTIYSFFYCIYMFLTNSGPCRDKIKRKEVGFILFLIVSVIGLYSLVHILTRFALPLAPVYLILAALAFN